MTEALDELTGRVLRAFADLAPTGRPARDRDHIDAPLVWLGGEGCSHFHSLLQPYVARRIPLRPSKELKRAAALDRLNHQARMVRLGIIWAAGTVKTDEGAMRLVTPLVSIPVHVNHQIGTYYLDVAGDYALTSLVEDRVDAIRLEQRLPENPQELQSIRIGSPLQQWSNAVLLAAGLPTATIVDAANPLGRTTGDLAIVPGGGLYFAGPQASVSRRAVLGAWSSARGIGSSAFAAIYGVGDGPSTGPDGVTRVISPLVLTEAQTAVVRRARTQRIVAVSGAPGNGKTHTACAVAIDAVARGAKVLVATKSSYASDVLADMLRRQPGPIPVVFGDSEQREHVARELAEGLKAVPFSGAARSFEHAADEQLRRVDVLRTAAARALAVEIDVERSNREVATVAALTVDVAGIFAPSTDLARATAMLVELRGLSSGGWLARRRARRIEARLRQVAQAAPDLPIETIEDALGAARRRREAIELTNQGGLDMTQLWTELEACEHELRRLVGEAVERRAVASRTDDDARRAVAALARALRAGRASRRELLALLDGSALLDALPLWVGTLGDIDDLLPASAGLFDLVILDESSEIDQLAAAPALLRGRAAVVVGDPQQLRAPSFVSDEAMREVLRANGIDALADRIDVRRDSAFDCAAGAAEVTWLDEHHRSVPHLIEFSARHFYTRPLRLVTRHPRNECFDAIDVVAVDEGSDADECRHRETAAVLRIVRDLADAGAKSVGVITPFRSCCDALTDEVLSGVPLDVVERTDLRVGTVHGFQGDERDVVIVALGLSSHDLPRRRGFVEDPGLFNVMVTRAKQRQIIVTSLTPAVGGLLGAYLAYAETAPTAPPGAPAPDAWTADLAVEMQRAGHRVRTEYPVGRWAIDLVLGSGADAVGLITRAHADGALAHIQRQLELRAASWSLIDAFPTRWDGAVTTAAIDLHARLTAAIAAGGDPSFKR